MARNRISWLSPIRVEGHYCEGSTCCVTEDPIVRGLLAKVDGYASSEALRRTRSTSASMGMGMSGKTATKCWTSVIILYFLRYLRMAPSPLLVSGNRYVDENPLNLPSVTNYRSRTIQKRGVPLPEADTHEIEQLDDDDTVYEIDRILKAKKIGNRYRLLVKWKGDYDPSPTWRSDLVNQTTNEKRKSDDFD